MKTEGCNRKEYITSLNKSNWFLELWSAHIETGEWWAFLENKGQNTIFTWDTSLHQKFKLLSWKIIFNVNLVDHLWNISKSFIHIPKESFFNPTKYLEINF